MAFDFPASPAEGQLFNPAGGPLYKFTNGAWVIPTTPPVMSIGDLPPANPIPGMLWWRSSDGASFLWFDDSTSKQWVQFNIGAFPEAPLDGQLYLRKDGSWAKAPGTAEARNRIINGAMQISQELGTTGSSAPSTYPADQWTQYYTGAPLAIGFAQAVGGTIHGSGYVLQAGIATAKPSLAAGDVVLVYQPIEGLRVADLLWGTAKAVPIVVRFTLNAPAGTYAFWMANGAGNRTYVKNFVVAANNVAQEFVLAIPGDTTGTWPTDNTLAIQFGFTYAAGSSFISATPGWQAGTARAVTGITNNVAAANSIYLSEVGFYVDPNNSGVAPPWQLPDYADELLACMRYFETLSGFAVQGYNTAGNGILETVMFKARKRVAPTMAAPGWAAANNATGQMMYGQTVDGVQAHASAGATGFFYMQGMTSSANARM